MKLIGTHNSATGEPGKGWLSYLVLPFAKTQSLTIPDQYIEGCRYFDLRVIKDGNDYRFAHGLWKSSIVLEDILPWLNCMAKGNHESCYLSITYEGRRDSSQEMAFVKDIKEIMTMYPCLALTYINVKKPSWKTLYIRYGFNGTLQGFKDLSKPGWHWLLPIPYLLDKICSRPHEFNEKQFTLVDFL